eukprot:365711-Chlamydomonas_euryale.AAC.10
MPLAMSIRAGSARLVALLCAGGYDGTTAGPAADQTPVPASAPASSPMPAPAPGFAQTFYRQKGATLPPLWIVCMSPTLRPSLQTRRHGSAWSLSGPAPEQSGHGTASLDC